MSTLLQPVGPEPPGVYWRRRAAVVLVVLVVVVALWWIFRPGGGDAEPVASASPTASATPTPSPTASASPTVSPTGSASPTASPTSTGDLAACEDAVIEVAASTGSASAPAGSSVKLTLKVTNGGSVACQRDVGPKENELKISSGGVHVWSSDDCNPSTKSDVVTLEPGESFSTTVTWDGRLSEPGCPANQPDAQPGGYDLVGRNGAVESPEVAFGLT